ncbi:MAG: hypothetical protein LLG04_12105 [Parachlamydia sp.]|nr:hypothetical protein [Parachlamydia sp.]
MDLRESKDWLWANWLSIIVGLVLPFILGWLWVFFRTPLETLSQHTLGSLVLVCVILACSLLGLLIYSIKRLLRITRFVNQKFYPNETIDGKFSNMKEQMEHDIEFSKGWEEEMK